MKIARLALLLSLAGLLLLLAGGPGYRLGFWGLGFGLLDAMRYALYLGAAGALLGAVFLLVPATRRQQLAGLAAAIVIGVGVAAVPIQIRAIAEKVPPIHDITTDTEDPPRFVAIRALRESSPNPPEYGGSEIAEQQRQAYPELGPLDTDEDAETVFDEALSAASDQGWEIVATAPEQGRIEATATTLWYGFKDDIIIRIQSRDDGARVDVRSKSRVGRSDLGANAARIERYLDSLRRQLEKT
ncbi:MAG: DUF1499 domain-containing protein [Wenzhouxiangellaceae bacterium]|nr:DUF1499 domain-containing protein [Wenzhouxiangellaceae bacterium]